MGTFDRSNGGGVTGLGVYEYPPVRTNGRADCGTGGAAVVVNRHGLGDPSGAGAWFGTTLRIFDCIDFTNGSLPTSRNGDEVLLAAPAE